MDAEHGGGSFDLGSADRPAREIGLGNKPANDVVTPARFVPALPGYVSGHGPRAAAGGVGSDQDVGDGAVEGGDRLVDDGVVVRCRQEPGAALQRPHAMTQ